MANPEKPVKARKKLTYFEYKDASDLQREELRMYLGELLGYVRCRVPDCSSDEFKLYVHFRRGSDVECRIHRGFENVRKELVRLVEVIEKEKSEDGKR
jgi:hypothetical protein